MSTTKEFILWLVLSQTALILAVLGIIYRKLDQFSQQDGQDAIVRDLSGKLNKGTDALKDSIDKNKPK